jgi:hypothetical protein
LTDPQSFDDLFFVRKINGMANGPNKAPIIAQNLVLAPLLSAMSQRIIAQDIHKMDRIIAPVITLKLLS